MSQHAERSWPEVDAPNEILLVPLGSTEQHGPHLPFDTDTRIAVAVADAAAAAPLSGVLVAPAIPYGASGEHQDFDGTMSIGTNALTMHLVELVRSTQPPFFHVVIVNGHGGNGESVTNAIDTLRDESRHVSAWSPGSVRHPGLDAHGGHTETSLMLHICPTLVRSDLVAAGNTEPIADLMPRLKADGVRRHSPTGVLGDPSDASAESGAKLFAEFVASLTSHLTEVAPTRLTRPV